MASEEAEKQNEEMKLDNKKEEDILLDENEILDYKKLYFSHPSQLNKKKKDFTEYTRIDMKLLNKKRERKKENKEQDENKINEDENNNQAIEEEKKEEKEENKEKEEKNNNNNDGNDKIDNKNEEEDIDLENNLPKELIEFIEERKDKRKFKAIDFEKYIIYKKLDINLSK